MWDLYQIIDGAILPPLIENNSAATINILEK